MTQRMKWLGCLRRHAPADPAAKLLLAIGGEYPRDTRRRIDSRLVTGRLDETGYTHAIEALEKYSMIHDNKVFVDDRDPDDWNPLLNGGFQGVKHLPKDPNEGA